jgi:ribosomal protein S11
MLLQGRGKVTTRSALALRQKTVETKFPEKLANAMNDIENEKIWKGVWEERGQLGLAKVSKNGPFAAALEGADVGHVVVVDKIENGLVKVRDPLGGTRYTMAINEFLRVRSGIAVIKVVP